MASPKILLGPNEYFQLESEVRQPADTQPRGRNGANAPVPSAYLET